MVPEHREKEARSRDAHIQTIWTVHMTRARRVAQTQEHEISLATLETIDSRASDGRIGELEAGLSLSTSGKGAQHVSRCDLLPIVEREARDLPWPSVLSGIADGMVSPCFEPGLHCLDLGRIGSSFLMATDIHPDPSSRGVGDKCPAYSSVAPVKSVRIDERRLVVEGLARVARDVRMHAVLIRQQH